MQWMEEQGRGFSSGPASCRSFRGRRVRSPRSAAWCPTREMGYAATENAISIDASKAHGAGNAPSASYLATMAMKGGFGCAIEHTLDETPPRDGCGECVGDVRDAAGGIIAGARTNKGFVRRHRAPSERQYGVDEKFEDATATNTTLAVVAVNSPRTSIELTQVARAVAAALCPAYRTVWNLRRRRHCLCYLRLKANDCARADDHRGARRRGAGGCHRAGGAAGARTRWDSRTGGRPWRLRLAWR